MGYEEIKNNENNHFQLIKSGIKENVIQGLLGLSLYGENFDLIQETLVEYSGNSDENIRGIAILCFGHIARIYGRINTELVLPIVQKGLKDKNSFVRGHSHSALDDIEFFVK